MASYKIYECDVCGSQSTPTQNQFKPDEWFYGSVDNLHISLPFIGKIEGEQGHFCSINCVKTFLGSLFDVWNKHTSEECDKFMQYNGSNFNENGLIMCAEDDSPQTANIAMENK